MSATAIFLSLLLYLIPHNDELRYEGHEIDLGTFPVFSLYKGKQQNFVADSLSVIRIYELVSKEKSIWYLKAKFNISEQIKNDQDIWLQLRSNVNAAEVYINNQLLIKNGIVGTSINREVGGRNLVRKVLSRSFLKSGKNILTVRFSNFKNQQGAIFKDISLGKLEDFQKHSSVMSTAPFIFSGVFLFAVFVNIALYFSLNRKVVFLILILLFSCNFSLMLYETFYWNGLVKADTIIHSIAASGWLEYLAFPLLTLALFYEFEAHKKYILGLLLLNVFLIVLAELTSFYTSLLLSFIPLGFSFWAVTKKYKNSNIICTSLLLLSLCIFLDDYDLIEGFDFVYTNFIVTSFIYKIDGLAMAFFALIMVFTSAKSILRKTKSLHEAQLKLERLEFQFLQKHIQPHFLMNTLMSLHHLVLKDPQNASKMIEALSEEFHLFIEISKKKLVPIRKEIEICKTHLKIMSIQQKANYVMDVIGIHGDEMIPPATLHTLVENGITHGYSGSSDAHFTLEKEQLDNITRYRLFNNSKGLSKVSKSTSGMGLKYIEARLSECFPNRWMLTSEQKDNGWETTIEITD